MFVIPQIDHAFNLIKKYTLDDAVDRLNYFLTPMILIFFTLTISTKQLFGSPIQCVVPAEFKSGWEEYIEDYCFIANSYIIKPHGQDYYAPQDIGERQESEIKYYQWAPIVLAIQALLFHLPFWCWKSLNKQSGLDMNLVLSDVEDIRKIKDAEARDQELEVLAQNLSENMKLNKKSKSGSTNLRPMGSFVTLLYCVTKVLYVLNIYTQFRFLDYLMSNEHIGTSYSFWGFEVLGNLFQGKEFVSSDIFPRVTFCDVVFAKLKSSSRHTIQCVLMINIWNEKIYLFLWFWFFFVGISTFINFVYCLFTMFPLFYRSKTTRRLLKNFNLTIHEPQSVVQVPKDAVFEHISRQELGREDIFEAARKAHREQEVKLLYAKFADEGLNSDGSLLLRFIESNAGVHVARELCAKLFKIYCKTRGHHVDDESVVTPDTSTSEVAIKMEPHSMSTANDLILNQTII